MTIDIAKTRPATVLQPRISVVAAFAGAETEGDLAARYASPRYEITHCVAAAPAAADPLAALGRRDRRADIAVLVAHPFIGVAEIEEALERLERSGASVEFLIPGLNELVTIGYVALACYDLRDRRLRETAGRLGPRLRRSLAPRLPLPLKQALKDGIGALGLLPLFGFTPAPPQPGATDPDKGVRISTQKSVAGVLDQVNRDGLATDVWLGGDALKRRFFVEAIQEHFPWPRTISLVLSNQCNLKCVMCPFHSPLFLEQRETGYFDDKKYMPLALVERLVAEISAKKPPEVPITFHMGELDEPLMHPKLVEIVRLLAAIPSATVHVTSNGNLVSERKARGLLEAGIKSVQFSVDAQTPETYKAIRGAKLEKVQRNVGRFLELRDEIAPDCYVNLCIINQREAASEIEDFKAYWRARGASSVSVYQLFEPEADNPAKWTVANKYYSEGQRTPCTAVWDQCFLYPEGEVSLCCTTLARVPQDGIIAVGNLNEETLPEIWFGQYYQRLREDLIFNRLDRHKYCADCDNWSSSYQYKKELADGTELIFGESMAYYFFPRDKGKQA